ncbi:tRNA lysidine(34) synthetase TilS [Oxalobacteraceae bacterium OM1]|nr:tRNA lysidine(34) synthetase TilS [Oxalobacteraceae bacterium OM1]
MFAFHVHHGLSPNAGHWLAHCTDAASSLGVVFDARRIQVDDVAAHGVEQAARHARYAALGEMCRVHGVPLLLTGHHQDDQAETVLLQLLRGSGIAGLGGMEAANAAPDLLGDTGTQIGRPLLSATRAELEEAAVVFSIAHVDDESNADTRYARNALRHAVMPALRAHFPGFEARLARAAGHAQAGQRLLDALAAEDLARCATKSSLDVAKVAALDADRRNNLLRHWFAIHGIRMPSAAWLEQCWRQVSVARDDARVRVTHADCEVHRYRNQVHLSKRWNDDSVEPMRFTWNGESRVPCKDFDGAILFNEAEEGIDPEWLRQQPLLLQQRQGGERLKPGAGRPTRPLKLHYQALGIPEWERPRLPLLHAGKSLLFAAGIGMHWQPEVPRSSPGIVIAWERTAGAAFTPV